MDGNNDIIFKSLRVTNKKQQKLKNFEKKFKKCLTERVEHDKLMKSRRAINKRNKKSFEKSLKSV